MSDSEDNPQKKGENRMDDLESDHHRDIPIWNQFSHPTRKKLQHYFLNFLTLIGIISILIPLLWMISSAFRTDNQLYTTPAPYLPSEVSLMQFEALLFETAFITYYINSIIVTIGVVVLTTGAATLGGYGLTRVDIPKKRTFARLVLFGYMFPSILLAIPMFILWRQIGIINSYIGLILAITATSLPFALWLMWKFFQTVPYSWEESAQMAGASPFRAFYEIALPQAKPGVIAVAIFSYAVAWNAYTIPKIIVPDEDMWVLTIGVETFMHQHDVLWGHMMAASVLMLIPSFLFIFVLQKYLLRGFQVGGN